jgi:NAD(P)H-flavin reductase
MGLPSCTEFAPSKLIAKRDVAADQVEIELDPPAGALEHYVRPGQFCRAQVRSRDGRLHEGIFAMLSAPGEGQLRFLIRTANPEGGEAADALAVLPIGSPVGITMPAGRGFALERAEGRDLHVVAAGTAIAPARAALEVVLRTRERYGRITLDYGLRSLAHLAIPEDVERWRKAGVEVTLHLSEPRSDGTVRGARAQDAAIARLRDPLRAAFVAVGPTAMVDELRALFAARGGDPSLVLDNL